MKKEPPNTAENEPWARPLDPLLAPASVVVVGASRDPKKRGYHAVRALLDSDFEGRIYPVNPRGGELFGLPVVTSLAELLDPPDVAFIATPAETVPDILEECARAGVKGAIVTAAGFRESGEHGVALEGAIVDVARRTGIRVVGPNTSGVLNTRVGSIWSECGTCVPAENILPVCGSLVGPPQGCCHGKMLRRHSYHGYSPCPRSLVRRIHAWTFFRV